jgi:LPXTG-site transpeptidase (sortase) family protein
MALAIYIKEDPHLKIKKRKKRDRFFYVFITLIGLFSISFAVWPIITWSYITLPKLQHKINDTPIPQGEVLSSAEYLSKNIQVVEDADGFSYFIPTEGPQKTDETEKDRPKDFQVTIPKLKIDEAKAKVDNLDFYNNLSHFPGSAVPGEVGNSFITGHSVLPQFNDPQNYRAIFTKLSDLEIGDDIYVKVDEKTLHYVVQYSKVVDPHDLTVLAPISENGKNLTLMTCVPPGTSTKRLVVITSLI